MPEIMSAQRLAEIYPEMRGYIEEYRDWVPAVYFDTNQLAALVIPRTEFFNALPAIGVSNVERPNEMPYRFIVLGWSWQVLHDPDGIPTIANALIIFEECELELEIDNDVKPSWPTFAVPGAGGINAEFSETNAALNQSVSNGVNGDEARYFHQPFVIDPLQTFRVFLNSSGVTALGAATTIRVCLHGIEARRPL